MSDILQDVTKHNANALSIHQI